MVSDGTGTLRIKTFGGLSIERDGEVINNFASRKAEALLVYLACNPRPHPREVLAELLWDDRTQRQAMANLRVVLSSLRKEVGGYVEITRSTAAIKAQAEVWLDARVLETAVAVGSHGEEFDSERIAQVLALYKGDFLAGFFPRDATGFESWASGERERLHRLALDALWRLGRRHLDQGQYVAAIAVATRQVEVAPLAEAGHRQLMVALARNGQPAQALAQYEACQAMLAEELGMAPTARTTELYEKILAGAPNFDAVEESGVRGYELKELIAEGGHGAVHRAIQPRVHREVAIKVIRRQHADDPDFIRRFEVEAQMVARLEHPYIVPLYDYWRDPSGAYLVMRYMRHGSLLSALKSGPWNTEQAANLLNQIAGALSVAHQKGVVHRDLKPGNILLDEAGNAYLTDFGIAKDLLSQEQVTSENAEIGTLDYTSPEQILSEEVTPQSDIYSLGAVIYETLTGEKPFADDSVARVLHNQLNSPMPLVTATRADIPAEVDMVLQKATAKKADERYTTAQEMAEAFIAAVGPTMTEYKAETADLLPEVVEIYNPYKGLRAFQEADADDFFGRDALVQQLVHRLEESENRFLAIVGPSGSGKSSTVKAGLIPALRSGSLPGSEHWFTAEMVPGTHPLEELELALWPVAVDPPPSLVEPMQRDTRGMLRTLRRILPREDGSQPQLLLIIDQFEELFTLVEDPKRREFFLDSLLVALNAPRSPLRVVITLRADFYDRPLLHQEWGQIIKDSTEIVLPLNHSELTLAVREPARRMGVRLDEELVTTIVGDVADQSGGLPLLQYALTELFERREGNLITREAYQIIGGVQGALGRRAETIYESLDENGREVARQLFLRLVTLGEGIEDTRRRVPRSELTGLTGNRRVVDEVLDQFGIARLLTFDRDPTSRAPTVEVAHEALLREWPRLRRWLEQSRDDVRLQRLLARAAGGWLNANQDEAYLLRGSRLDQFEAWSEETQLALTQDEETFLDASLAARTARQEEEEARRRRELEAARQLAESEKARADEQARAAAGLRRRAVMLGGALLIAAVLALAAFFFAQQSNRNAAEAEDNADAAQQNADVAATNEAQAFVNLNIANTREAEAVAAEAAAVSARDEVQAEAFARATAEAEALENEQEALHQASIGLASQAELEMNRGRPDLAVHLSLEALENYPYSWQAERALGQAVVNNHLIADLVYGQFSNHSDPSPDGTRIVSGYEDGTARVWDVSTGELIHTLSGHTAEVYRLYWSPSGDRILTASRDNTVRVWDAETGEELFVLTPGGYYGFWSPDGTRIFVNRTPDRKLEVFDATTGEHLASLSHGAVTMFEGGWSPDGDRFVTVNFEGEAKIWDAATFEEILTFPIPEGPSFFPQFSPDGTRIKVHNFDTGTAQIYDANTGEELHVLPGGSWSPSGDRILIGRSGVVRVLDAISGEELLSLGAPEFSWTSWSFDGQFILAAGGEGRIMVWDAATGTLLMDVAGDPVGFADAGWFPNSATFWTAGSGTTRVWQVSNAIFNVVNPIGNAGATRVISEIAWSPSGNEIAIGFQGAVKIWDLATKNEVLNLTFERQPFGLFGSVGTLAWSPVGNRILAGDFDGLLRVWDTTTGEELLTIPAHEEEVQATAWSPDGDRFISVSGDGTSKVWDAESGERLLTFDEHIPLSVSWSPDGRKVVTASADDNSAIIWDPDTGQVLLDLFPSDFAYGVLGVGWSPDGEKIATISTDGLGRLWDPDSGEQLLAFNGPSNRDWISWSPSADYLSIGGQVFKTSTGDQLLDFSDKYDYVSWSPQGTAIALNNYYRDLTVFPIWQSREELIDTAKSCCLFGELTAEERLEFGLPPQEE